MVQDSLLQLQGEGICRGRTKRAVGANELGDALELEQAKRLELLDYGRFFAAMAVLLFHYTFNGIYNGKISSLQSVPSVSEFTKYGYLGVDLFFMISGYVIFLSSQNKTPGQFIKSRLIRLYPAFWFAVISASLLTILWGNENISISWQQVIANLTMIPPVFGYDAVDGVYWTLMYELTFYIAVFFLMAFGLEKKLRKVFLIWPFLMLLAWVLQAGYFPFFGGHYTFFAAGAIFAVLKNERTIFAWISLLVAFCLCIDFVRDIALLKSDRQSITYQPDIVSAIIISFFLFFIVLNTRFGAALKLPKSYLLGVLTYPLYLIHVSWGYILLNHFATDGNKYAAYIAVTVIVLAISFCIHKIIEVRLGSFWRALFSGRWKLRPAATVA